MLDKSITFFVNCDFCSESFDTDEEEFMAAVNAMKKDGWKVFKEKNEWQHKCPSCHADDFDEVC